MFNNIVYRSEIEPEDLPTMAYIESTECKDTTTIYTHSKVK